MNNNDSVYGLYAYGKTQSNYQTTISYDSSTKLGINNLSDTDKGNVKVKTI